MWPFYQSPDHVLRARLLRVERQLTALLDHFHIELPDDGLAEVRELVQAGQKIAAIKLYRQLTGAGLAEAKEAVERRL